MPFTTPLALLGLLFIPAVIAMYLLKLRRDEAVVPSTLLWTRLVADVEANAPWQKLRRSLLLLLQLLLVAILALLAARPVPRAAGRARARHRPRGRHLGEHGRHGRRAGPARRPPRRPPSRRCGTCRPAARSASSPPIEAPGSSSTSRATSARPPGDRGDPGRRRAAATSATRSSSPRSSRRARATPRSSSPPTRRSRSSRRGQGRCADQGPAGRSRPQEPGDRRPRRPDVAVGGDAIGVRQRRQPRPRASARAGSSCGATTACSRRATSTLDAAGAPGRDHRRRPARRRGARGPARRRRDPAATGAPDQLAIDDRAWAVVPPDRKRLVLVVGEGDPYLETALSLPAQRRAVRRDAGGVRAGDGRARTAGRGTSSSSRATCRRRCRRRRSWRSPRRGPAPLGEVTGTLKDPGIGSLDPDEPILRYVDLSTTHIAEAVAAGPARTGRGRSSRDPRALRCCTPASGPACRPRSSPSSRASPTCRSRSPSRSCWPT